MALSYLAGYRLGPACSPCRGVEEVSRGDPEDDAADVALSSSHILSSLLDESFLGSVPESGGDETVDDLLEDLYEVWGALPA